MATADTSAPLQALLDVLAGRVGGVAPVLDARGWDTLVAEASRHAVSALAWRGLAHCPDVPAGVLHALQAHHVRNRLRTLRLYAHLAGLLEALQAASIDAIVLKGAHLAQAVYGEAALRPMSDADVLVRADDLARAAAVLNAAGWRGGEPLSAGGHQLSTFQRDGVPVDLHWSIEDERAPFAIDVDGLWDRAVPMRIGAARARALSPPDLLLHLCLHAGYGHGWKQFDGGLRHLADIAEVVRHHGATLAWDEFVARAQAWGAQRCVGLCLVTARDLLDAPVPAAVLQNLPPAQPRWSRVARELATGGHYVELARDLPVLARSWVDKRWCGLAPAARWRELLLPAAATLRHEYPSLEASAPLRVLAHWKDLALELGRASLDARGQALLARERERRALIAWLEGAG